MADDTSKKKKPGKYPNDYRGLKTISPPKSDLKGYLGQGMARQAATAIEKHNQQLKDAASFKKGGKVKKTGIYKLHKGEKVIPKKKVESIKSFMTRRNKKKR